MTKEAKKKISDPLPEALINMDFTSEGLSWVKDIYQKLEISCNEYVDACNKYVNTAGEHFKKIYDEVLEWENSPDCVKGPVSDLSLKHDPIIEVSDKLLVELDDNSSNEKLGACDNEVQATVSISEVLRLVTSSNEPQGLSHKDACDGDNDESLSTEAINSSDVTREVLEKVSDTATSPADLVSSLRQDDALPPESRDGGGLSIVSDYISSIEINEISDGKEDIMSSSPDVVNRNGETEEFEDVKFEDCWDDTEKNEIALISHRASKNISYKKKLRNVFISKVRSRKDYNLVDDQYDGVNLGMQNRQMIAISSVPNGDFYPNTSSTQDSNESEWELL